MKNKIQLLVDEANKEWGDGALILPELGGKMINEEIETITTGFSFLDEAIGIKGVPCGRITEVMGQEACLAENTKINYIVWGKDGNIKNHKGGTIKNLYRRIHGKKHPNADSDVFYTVPSFNEENAIFHNHVYDVVKTGLKECFLIKTKSGKEILATKEHKFFTSSGFKPLFDLSVGDKVFIHNNTPFKGRKKETTYMEIFVKYHPNNRKKTVTANNRKGEKVYSFLRYRVRKSHLIYEAFMNKMSYEEYKKLLDVAPKIIIDRLWTVPKDYEIHHIDENRRNDVIENLTLVKAGEHQRVHALKNHNKLRFIIQEDEIVFKKSIGKRETYDIKCLAPYNNYIANGFAVHNSGKSTLVLHLIKQAQQMGKRCALIDTEHSLDKERAIKIGVDFNSLIISQPDSAEQALDLLDYLINSKQIGFVAIDSVAALVPKAELEGEMADANIGLQARLMGKILRKIVAPTNKYNVCVIFTNQVRAKLGGFSFIPQETTPGGNALKFYASLRLDIKKTGAKKKGDRLQYTTHKMTVKKNKLAPPLKVVEFNIDENGIRSDVINSDVI